MAVGEPDRQVGAGSGIMQRVESVCAQPFGPAAQRGIVLVPGRDRIIIIDARGRKDRLRKLCDGDILFVARKNLLRPGRARIGDDVPVDVEIGDLLQRRLIGDRIGLAGPRHPGRVFAGQQHRIFTDDRKPRGVGGKRLRYSLIKPAGGAIKTVVRRKPIARQRHHFIRQDRRNKTSSSLVGRGGRGHQQVLARL